MKKRFSEQQIIGFLREAEAGLAVKDLCRVQRSLEVIRTARSFAAHGRGLQLRLIDPGKSNQNAYIESFNGRLRDECLSVAKGQ